MKEKFLCVLQFTNDHCRARKMFVLRVLYASSAIFLSSVVMTNFALLIHKPLLTFYIKSDDSPRDFKKFLLSLLLEFHCFYSVPEYPPCLVVEQRAVKVKASRFFFMTYCFVLFRLWYQLEVMLFENLIYTF